MLSTISVPIQPFPLPGWACIALVVLYMTFMTLSVSLYAVGATSWVWLCPGYMT